MYDQVPAFRDRLDQLDDAIADLHPRIGGSLRGFLHAEPSAEAERRLMQTEVCQPAMAALGLALHAVLEKLGVRGDVALGHSRGEFAAAAAAGVLSAEDAVRLVARRGLAMVDLRLPDPGAMASAAASPEEVAEAVRGIDGVVIASFNHPKQTVISGTSPGIKAASEKREGRGIQVTPLDVSHAFHSPLMAGIAQTMGELVAKIAVAPGAFPVVSAITARPYAGDAREIWVQHASAPLDFVSALRSASALGARIFLQVGAGSVLTSFARATLPQEERAVNVALASRDEDGLLQLAIALGHVWAAGIGLDAAPLFEGRDASLITLPPTPLDTQPYWPVERPRTPAAPMRLPSAAQEMTEMDPLVALFREQVALLQQQAKVLEQQAAALAGKGVSLPQLPVAPPAASAIAPVPAPALPQTAPAVEPPIAAAAKETAASNERVGKTILASVARISAFPPEAIKPSQTLAGDLGFDSLMTVELDADVNRAFPGAGGLPRNLLGLQTTVQDIIDHVARAVAQPHAPVAPVLSPILGEMASEGRELKPFAPAFVESALSATAEDPLPRRLLLTRDSLGVADALAKLLNDAGHDAVLGEPGDPLAGIGGVIHLAPLGRAGSELEPGFGAVLEAHRIARAQAANKAGGMFGVATAGLDARNRREAGAGALRQGRRSRGCRPHAACGATGAHRVRAVGRDPTGGCRAGRGANQARQVHRHRPRRRHHRGRPGRGGERRVRRADPGDEGQRFLGCSAGHDAGPDPIRGGACELGGTLRQRRASLVRRGERGPLPGGCRARAQAPRRARALSRVPALGRHRDGGEDPAAGAGNPRRTRRSVHRRRRGTRGLLRRPARRLVRTGAARARSPGAAHRPPAGRPSLACAAPLPRGPSARGPAGAAALGGARPRGASRGGSERHLGRSAAAARLPPAPSPPHRGCRPAHGLGRRVRRAGGLPLLRRRGRASRIRARAGVHCLRHAPRR